MAAGAFAFHLAGFPASGTAFGPCLAPLTPCKRIPGGDNVYRTL